MTRHRLALIHPADPRSVAPGLAARLEGILARRPDDFSILFVGVDECGDLALDRPARLEAAGRPYDFLPVMRTPRSGWTRGADVPWGSRLAFRVAFLRRLSVIRALADGERASTELHDVGWAPLARLLGNPIVQVVDAPRPCAGHLAAVDEFVALRLASRIVGDHGTVRRLRGMGAAVAAKTEVLRLPSPVGLVEPDVCPEIEIQRLYERHRRFYRVGRAGAARPAVA